MKKISARSLWPVPVVVENSYHGNYLATVVTAVQLGLKLHTSPNTISLEAVLVDHQPAAREICFRVRRMLANSGRLSTC